MLDLAQICKNLQVFMYVSTAYSHCYEKEIYEEFYRAPADLKTVHDLMEADKRSPNGLSETLLKMNLEKWPNMYTFSKATAEDLIRQHAGNPKTVYGVFRPSIGSYKLAEISNLVILKITIFLSFTVISTYKEPLAGWCGNSNGPVMLFIGCGVGAIHVFYYRGDPVDLVPLDLSINALLAVTWDLSKKW